MYANADLSTVEKQQVGHTHKNALEELFVKSGFKEEHHTSGGTGSGSTGGSGTAVVTTDLTGT